MSTITILDDATRPRAPKIEGLSPMQEWQGKRLALIHRMHLEEMDHTRRIMEQIEAGQARLADLGDAVTSLNMAESYKAFGNLCGRECQLLSFHHTAEDQAVFPALDRQGSEGLRKVVERLRAEHEVIHALLEELQARALAAVDRADAHSFASLKETLERLDATVRSHFRYEEGELEQALGYHEVEF
jgi:iron-sulfur cluster repair protein YtfE (RIC family)